MENDINPRPRKRRSSDFPTSSHLTTPATKRLRSWKKKHPPLMELPPEIRLKILKELLWQQEPLRILAEATTKPKPCPCNTCSTVPTPQLSPRKSNFRFTPAVLRVCKTLHREGLPLLYDNSFFCELWYDDDAMRDSDTLVSSFLRPDWNLHNVPLAPMSNKHVYAVLYLLDNVKRLDVTVRVKGIESCSTTRQIVRKFVYGTRRLPQLAHLNILLDLPPQPTQLWEDSPEWTYESGKISRDDYRDQALGPFALIRRMKTVIISGVSSDITDELIPIMTGDSVVVDLNKMYIALADYTQKFVIYSHCVICRKVLGYLERALHAADMEDEAAFRKARSTIFSLISDHQNHDRDKACQHDPVPGAKEDIWHPLNIDLDELGIESESGYSEDDLGIEWSESMQQDWEQRNEETEDARRQREIQEQQRPSLIRLREIVRWERDESPWSQA